MDPGAVGIADAHGSPLLVGLIPTIGIADIGAGVTNGGVERVQDHANDPAASADADGLPLVAGGEVVGSSGWSRDKQDENSERAR